MTLQLECGGWCSYRAETRKVLLSPQYSTSAFNKLTAYVHMHHSKVQAEWRHWSRRSQRYSAEVATLSRNLSRQPEYTADPLGYRNWYSPFRSICNFLSLFQKNPLENVQFTENLHGECNSQRFLKTFQKPLSLKQHEKCSDVCSKIMLHALHSLCLLTTG